MLKLIKKNAKIIIIVGLLIIATAFISWKITMSSLSLLVTDDTAFITSFGYTGQYDYIPNL